MFSQGCVCSLLANSLPVDVDDFFVDSYYLFNKSGKRKQEFQEFTSTKEFKIIKTHWLSLEKAVRVLHQWSALHAYFDREAEDDMSARTHDEAMVGLTESMYTLWSLLIY